MWYRIGMSKKHDLVAWAKERLPGYLKALAPTLTAPLSSTRIIFDLGRLYEREHGAYKPVDS